VMRRLARGMRRLARRMRRFAGWVWRFGGRMWRLARGVFRSARFVGYFDLYLGIISVLLVSWSHSHHRRLAGHVPPYVLQMTGCSERRDSSSSTRGEEGLREKGRVSSNIGFRRIRSQSWRTLWWYKLLTVSLFLTVSFLFVIPLLLKIPLLLLSSFVLFLFLLWDLLTLLASLLMIPFRALLSLL